MRQISTAEIMKPEIMRRIYFIKLCIHNVEHYISNSDASAPEIP